MAPTAGIETANDQLVGKRGDHIIVMAPNIAMTPTEALRHAAWLVAVTGDDDQFAEILAAVRPA
jgi:hypothetical protein